MICPKCKNMLSHDSVACNKCGYQFPQINYNKESIICPQCQNALPLGSVACNKCGHFLGNESTSQIDYNNLNQTTYNKSTKQKLPKNKKNK